MTISGTTEIHHHHPNQKTTVPIIVSTIFVTHTSTHKFVAQQSFFLWGEFVTQYHIDRTTVKILRSRTRSSLVRLTILGFLRAAPTKSYN